MKKIFLFPIFVFFCCNTNWSQCPATVTISGTYVTANTGSNTWIATSGATTIPTGANVKLDANPSTNGYVQLNPGFETQTNATFLAVVATPCTLLSNESFNAGASFLLYPNPVASSLNIESLSIINSISIADLNGRIVFNSKNDSNKITINMDHFSSGIYLLKVANSEGVSFKKVVKK